MTNESIIQPITHLTHVIPVLRFLKLSVRTLMLELFILNNAIALHRTGRLWSDTTMIDLFLLSSLSYVFFKILRNCRLRRPDREDEKAMHLLRWVTRPLLVGAAKSNNLILSATELTIVAIVTAQGRNLLTSS